MNNFAYPVTLTPDEGGFVVTFADFPEAITQGDDLEDALAQAADCLDEAVAGRMRNSEDIPVPSPCGETACLVHLPAQTAIKAMLYKAMRVSRKSRTDVARLMNCDEKEVRRLLNPRHSSRLPRIESALKSLGYRLVIDSSAMP